MDVFYVLSGHNMDRETQSQFLSKTEIHLVALALVHMTIKILDANDWDAIASEK